MSCRNKSLASVRKTPCTLFNKTAPAVPGRYYWGEYNCEVDVIKRGKYLYVTPPGPAAVEVRVSPRIAGTWLPAFRPFKDTSNDGGFVQ